MKTASNKYLPWVASHKNKLKVEKLGKRWEKLELTSAIDALDLQVQEGYHVQESTVYGILRRCMSQKDLALGKRMHDLAIRSGNESSAFLANHIVAMYASHGKLEEAATVFTKVPAPNVFMWCSIISAHVEHKQPSQAIKLYWQMRQSSVKPNSYVYVAALKACAQAGDLCSGKVVHADILGGMTEPHVFVGSSLVDMYSKCGSLEDARKVFDRLRDKDVVTWNAMISGYARLGLGKEALDVYRSMQKDGIAVGDFVTFVCLLKACASVGALDTGKQLHEEIQRRGLEGNQVVSNCLVHMYAKCGSLEDACSVFRRLPRRDLVTWTAMIAGFAQRGLGRDALCLYADMQQEGSGPADLVTFICLLQACASVGALDQGKQLHAQIQQAHLETHVVVGNCLVNMYAKCGQIEDARQLFDSMPTKNVVTWNALLHGYAQHGGGQIALQSFQVMQEHGVKPNDTTFICLLVACSLAGLVPEGRRLFQVMEEEYGITPTGHHYSCMVDVLARSGHLDEAEHMLHSMPFSDDIVGWTSLLTACKSHVDVDRGKRCFDRLISLNPGDASAYMLLARIYANAGRWDDVDHVETLRKAAGAEKKPAMACIEVMNRVLEFHVGDEWRGTSSKLKQINSMLEEGGHAPHTDSVLKALSEQDKKEQLCGHAEKLALAYGLLRTPDGATLVVTKNLRMCSDCHTSTKIMSRLEHREIIVRDAHRVHRFQDGVCSCGDRN